MFNVDLHIQHSVIAQALQYADQIQISTSASETKSPLLLQGTLFLDPEGFGPSECKRTRDTLQAQHNIRHIFFNA